MLGPLLTFCPQAFAEDLRGEALARGFLGL
jgi:hypothetical protein